MAGRPKRRARLARLKKTKSHRVAGHLAKTPGRKAKHRVRPHLAKNPKRKRKTTRRR